MEKPSKSSKVGRAVLLALATGTIAVSGCLPIGSDSLGGQQSAMSEELREFESAVNSNDPVLVARFLRRYPNGQVRSMLTAQSPELLGRLAPDAFNQIPISTLRSLPRSVMLALPPAVLSRLASANEASNNSGPAEDPYSG